MQPLEVNDFVETPLGRGTVANLVRSRIDGELTGEVVVKLDFEIRGDRYWRVFKLEEVKKWPTST